MAHGDGGKLIRFGLVPQVAGDRPEAAGEDEERRPAVQEQLRAALGHRRVVAAQHENRVGAHQVMMQLVVVPELLGERVNAGVHANHREIREIRELAWGKSNP